MRPQGRANMLMLHPQNEWRHPDRPIIQITAPYVFVADEPCYVVQTAPYLDYFPTPRPGVQMGGRFPVHVWPRPLSWGFEWHDVNKPLVLKRGEFATLDGLQLFALTAGAGSAVLLPFAVVESLYLQAFPTRWDDWQTIFGVALVSALIPFWIFQHGVRTVGPTRRKGL